MGFKVGRVFVLEGEFKDTDAEGAHVTVRSTSINVIEEMRDSPRPREIELVAKHLVGWDLETEDGVPIPATVDGLRSLEEPLFILIANEWLKATRGISHPFDRRSDDGEPSPTGDEPAPSIPMETS